VTYPISLPFLDGGFSILTITYSTFLSTFALRATSGANHSVNFHIKNFQLATYGSLSYLAASELRLFQSSWATTLRFIDSEFDPTHLVLIY
jgi:hypothetical protein